MPPQLKKNEDTSSIQLKVPMSLKRKATKMAKFYQEGDGNLSRWLRSLIETRWSEFKTQKKRAA